MIKSKHVAEIYKELQKEIVRKINIGDGGTIFSENPWTKEIGSGLTCVMKDGAVIEKAGLNFSHVNGNLNDEIRNSLQISSAEKYSATGISSIIHPNNPHIPIIHMNVRFFELDNGQCWFGGGIDLTPHYVDKEESKWFHCFLEEICNRYNSSFYCKFKKYADEYFYLKHRYEKRGVGGIFFDRLQPKDDSDFENILNFTIELTRAYAKIYCEIMDRKRHLKYTEKEKRWQNFRRGRYVEFNLIHDRGTKFGLNTNGNIESILISMPPVAGWEYNFTAESNTKEEETLSLLRKDIDWINTN